MNWCRLAVGVGACVLVLSVAINIFLNYGPHGVSDPAVVTNPQVLWMAPFFSGGGYCSEAQSFVDALSLVPNISIAISQHGDGVSMDYVFGMPRQRKKKLLLFTNTELLLNETVVICHSEPGAWYPPLYQTSECPPRSNVPFFKIVGRTMGETDMIPEGWVPRCNSMDEVWVPTQFHREVFIRSGVDSKKIVVVPEPVDTDLFDPHSALPLEWVDQNIFTFLSVAKWEERKGYDILIQSYMEEFSVEDNVQLLILTHEYHTSREVVEAELKELSMQARPDPKLQPRVSMIQNYLSDDDMPRLYASIDCLVVPSRGEGWGRPHIEAMAMGVPVIATNWSGNTEFMLENNSYLISVEKMVHPKSGPFRTFHWAEPSKTHLKQLMRHVVTNPAAAKAVGEAGRQHVIEHYNPLAIAKLIRPLLQSPAKK
ncbi:group 1 family glycosyltransferase [Pelomyxa schiedti]|nr:group 1 family glycosyltransferase [Pelomyxa schiedti]